MSSDYMRQNRKLRIKPDNPYSHGYSLLESELSEEEELGGFSSIVDKFVQTSNISSEFLLASLSSEADCLTHLRDMVRREPQLIAYYLVLKHRFRNRLLLYKAYQGTERGQQGAVGKSGLAGAFGFGNDYYNDPRKEENKQPEGGGILSRFIHKKEGGGNQQ